MLKCPLLNMYREFTYQILVFFTVFTVTVNVYKDDPPEFSSYPPPFILLFIPLPSFSPPLPPPTSLAYPPFN